MITTTSNKLSYSYSIEVMAERAVMHSSYSRRMAAHGEDTTFQESVMGEGDSAFIEDAISAALCELKEMFQFTHLSVETSISGGVCSIELEIPDGRSLALSDIDIIDTLSERYILETILKEWATVVGDSVLLSSSGASIEALKISINEALMWLIVPPCQKSYRVKYLS